MIAFWLLAGLMLAGALAMVLPALVGRGRTDSRARKEVNVAIYKERLAELKADVESGRLNPEQFELARSELEQGLLEDVTGEDDKQRADPPTRRLLWAAATALAVPALALGLYMALGERDMVAMSAADLAKAREQEQVAEAHSVEEMVTLLNSRLQQQPDDAQGWLLLARSSVALKRYGEAVIAFTNAHRLLGDDPRLLADYAEALALANGNRLQGRPTQLATRALELQPDNPKALWIAGVAAMQRGDRSSAVGYLQRLQKHLPANSEAAKMVATYLAQATSARAPATSTPSVPTAPPGSTAPAAPPGATAARGETSATARLEVKVTLDPALVTRAAPDDTVFIFAQATQGPRMPLAIVRKQVKALPVTVTLDDSLAMMPAMRLSQFKEVVVGARVSKSGQATPRSGDLEGRTGLIRLDSAKTVKVTIDRVRP